MGLPAELEGAAVTIAARTHCEVVAAVGQCTQLVHCSTNSSSINIISSSIISIIRNRNRGKDDE